MLHERCERHSGGRCPPTMGPPPYTTFLMWPCQRITFGTYITTANREGLREPVAPRRFGPASPPWSTNRPPPLAIHQLALSTPLFIVLAIARYMAPPSTISPPAITPIPPATVSFQPVPGYDLCTGWGTYVLLNRRAENASSVVFLRMAAPQLLKNAVEHKFRSRPEKGPDGKIKQSTRKKKHVESERHCTDGAPCSRPHYSKQRLQDGIL